MTGVAWVLAIALAAALVCLFIRDRSDADIRREVWAEAITLLEAAEREAAKTARANGRGFYRATDLYYLGGIDRALNALKAGGPRTRRVSIDDTSRRTSTTPRRWAR